MTILREVGRPMISISMRSPGPSVKRFSGGRSRSGFISLVKITGAGAGAAAAGIVAGAGGDWLERALGSEKAASAAGVLGAAHPVRIRPSKPRAKKKKAFFIGF